MSPRTIVVTGTSSGFGRAIVEQFAARGWRVAATVRRPQDHPALFAALPGVRLFALDVADAGQAAALAADVRAAYGRVDVLVNNAGHLLMGPLETCSMEQIRAQYETNVFGLIAVTRAFLPQLRDQGGGVIINIASASAKVNYPFLAAYGSSKWAVAGLSEALAVELAPFKIRVKTIFPGAHATKIFTKIRDGLAPAGDTAAAAAYRPYFENFIALQDGVPNVASPRSVARLVYRAACDAGGRAEYVTGRDAALMELARRLLPRRAIAAMLVASITRPPAAPLLRLMRRVMGGTEPVEVVRGGRSGPAGAP